MSTRQILILASGRSYHATRWANSLANRGLNIAFVTVHKVERPLSPKIEVFQLSSSGSKGYILDILKLKKIINKWKPDILHAHYATGYGLMSALTGFKTRIVSIYGADIYDFPRISSFHRYLLKFNLYKAKVILSTSESMADEYLSIYPKFSRPIVTPFGVDTNIFRPIKFKKNAKAVNIGIVKKMEEKYGIDILLNSFFLLREMLPDIDITLHIVGTGTKLEDFKKLTLSLGINDYVKFYGQVNNLEIPVFLNDLDIFVVSSRYDSESFGVAAVEAQSCGLPVIVSNVGGLPEVVKDNETGLVVPKENPQELANAMKLLCENESYRKRLGDNGRKRVLKLYDWKNNVDLMYKIYKGVLGL